MFGATCLILRYFLPVVAVSCVFSALSVGWAPGRVFHLVRKDTDLAVFNGFFRDFLENH